MNAPNSLRIRTPAAHFSSAAICPSIAWVTEPCAWWAKAPGASRPTQPKHSRVLRRAVELGVTLIDTADAYGPEIAERLIGEALYPYPPGLVIATKGGITRQGPAKTEYVGRAGYLIQCVEMSLRRLKLERIDLYQLHRIDPRTPLEEIARRTEADAGAGQDSPHWLERGDSGGD